MRNNYSRLFFFNYSGVIGYIYVGLEDAVFWMLIPYWKIMENSSRNLSEIFIFWVVHTDCFTGKLIHSNLYLLVHWNHIWYVTYHMWHLVWMSFPVIRSVWRPRIPQLTIGWVFQSRTVSSETYDFVGRFFPPFGHRTWMDQKRSPVRIFRQAAHEALQEFAKTGCEREFCFV